MIRSLLVMIDKNPLQKNRLFVDVTEFHIKDTGSGVQRVTRNILSNLYKLVKNYEIIEVMGKRHGAGFYNVKTNKPIKISSGDVFFGLDLSKFRLQHNKLFLDKMNKNGVRIWFFVHDLIPLLYPELIASDFKISEFEKWAETIVRYDGIIANSKATMDSVKEWLQKNPKIKCNRDLKFSYVHLGADFHLSNKITNLSEKNDDALTFLMVSTIEPKKNYSQVIKAFELLWQENINVQLNIVGRLGWKSDDTAKMILESKYYEKKLFWFNTGISDEELAMKYSEANAVIVASIVEGFGLALVEGAAYKKPLIVRDIPVFREIADNNAFYFSGFEPDDLSEKIKEWTILYKKNEHPKPTTYLETWESCTQKICGIMNLQ